MKNTMNPTLAALAGTLLSTSTDDQDCDLDAHFTVYDVDKESLEKLNKEYSQFLEEVGQEITKKIGDKWDCIDDFYDIHQPAENQTEHDYIMTRNHHGCGFWDGDWSSQVSEILTKAAQKLPEIEVYAGDDKKIYFV